MGGMEGSDWCVALMEDLIAGRPSVFLAGFWEVSPWKPFVDGCADLLSLVASNHTIVPPFQILYRIPVHWFNIFQDAPDRDEI